jgi:hypothetical protein
MNTGVPSTSTIQIQIVFPTCVAGQAHMAPCSGSFQVQK